MVRQSGPRSARAEAGIDAPMPAREGSAPYWSLAAEAVVSALGSGEVGLSADEARRRLAANGPNSLPVHRGARGLRLFIAQFTSPIVLILIGATVVSLLLGDVIDALIILGIIAASGTLGFWQEHSAGRAVDALTSQVQPTTHVLRDGRDTEIPSDQLVVGDVVLLTPGSVVPADCRVLTSTGLLLDESVLTGESYPVAKNGEAVAQDAPLSARASAVFMGTHVLTGTGSALVVRTATASEFGRLSAELRGRDVTTSFERGATSFGMMLVRAMTVLVAAVLLINLVLHRPLLDALLFSLALAVGLTPQLLPAIVAVSLSKGAQMMAAEKVIVRRLDAIEDFGSMTVLCTDKTGTLTEGSVRLDAALDLTGAASDTVLRLAWLNASLQRGFPNPLDLAITGAAGIRDQAELLGEVPYDFQRKRLSVLARDRGEVVLITKGAFDRVADVCVSAEMAGTTVPLSAVLPEVERLIEDLTSRGLRVLGVATKAFTNEAAVTEADESGMVLRGLLSFADPPKDTAAQAVSELHGLGVSVVMITGDSRLAARHTAAAVGLPVDDVLTGDDISRLSDESLRDAVRKTRVCAEVEPLQKERIVRALSMAGESVGFLGDGINDAAALHAADIGISVDTAVEVAQQAASIVLLDKSLGVVADGMRLGRRTFANTLKYVRVTISANFGNVLSMAAASAFLPFLPLLPTQILLLNFISDIPALTISTDAVDPEQTLTPERWDIREIRRFMVSFGLLSSLFDIMTFAVLHIGFRAQARLFRSGWFVESTVTELAAMLVLRTMRRFHQSRPSRALAMSSVGVLIVTVALPYSPLAKPLGLVPVPVLMLLALGVLTALYVLSNEMLKDRFYRPRG